MKMFRQLFITLLLILSAPLTWAAVEPIDKIIAIVNDDVVTANELAFRMHVVKEQMTDAKVTLPSDSLMRPQVLDRKIEQMLALQTAKRYGITVDDQALSFAVEAVAKNNRTTVSGLREILEKDGVNYTAFLEDLRKQVTVQRTEQALVGGKINMSQEEVNHIYQQYLKSTNQHKEYRLGHILISLPKDPSVEQLSAAQKKAQEAMQALEVENSDFFNIALKYSDSKDVLNQADLGLRKRTELPTIFGDAVDPLKQGDVAGPIRSSSGLHLVKVLELKNNAQKEDIPAEQLKSRIQQQLFQRKLNEALQNWYTQLRDEASVQVM